MAEESQTEPCRRLLAALAQHPDAPVGVMTGEGRFCPVPPSLTGILAGRAHFPGESPFDAVDPETWGALINGWKHTMQHGIGGGAVRDLEGNDVSVVCYDVRPDHDVLVALMVAGPADAVPDLAEELALSTRFGILARDVVGKITGQDEGAAGLLGWTLDEISVLSDAELIHPDDRANSQAHWLDMLGLPGRPRRWRGRHRHADGSWRWLEVTNTNRIDDPAVGHVVCEMMDISEEMAATEALRERQEVLDRLHDALPLGVCQLDRDRHVTYANDQLYALVGCTPAGDLVEALREFAAADLPALSAALDAVLAVGADQTLELRVHVPGEAERVCLVDLRALRDGAEVTGALVCVSDITEATMLRHELEMRATLDVLTGCHNRAATMTALEQAMDSTHTDDSGRGTAVIFIDLDRFKPINDELGHAAGDELLGAVATRLRRLVRDGDIVGRVGGDEFLIVCPGTHGPDAATPVARRIADALAAPVVIAGRAVQVSASVGVAWTNQPGASADSLVASADTAMYASKRGGRSEVVVAA